LAPLVLSLIHATASALEITLKREVELTVEFFDSNGNVEIMFPLKHDANLEASAENHENSSFNVSSVTKRKESLPFLIPEFRPAEDEGLKFTTFSFLHRKFVWKLPAKRSSIANLEGSLSCLKDNLNEDEKAFKDSYEQFMCVFHTVHAMSQAMPKLDKT